MNHFPSNLPLLKNARISLSSLEKPRKVSHQGELDTMLLHWYSNSWGSLGVVLGPQENNVRSVGACSSIIVVVSVRTSPSEQGGREEGGRGEVCEGCVCEWVCECVCEWVSVNVCVSVCVCVWMCEYVVLYWEHWLCLLKVSSPWGLQ